ncbi:hypothetical protein [Psychrobacter arcticus]|uniref:hypothetical protein n=1 Tax=Psychrobacter arcticus TaxID=334543 RepID=UPI000312D208|nr:hypothetical protein [Psychrobacter arcticus]
MKALLLTNHLINYAGSEIQILEVYNLLKNKNFDVHVFANITGAPIIDQFSKSDILSSLDGISPADYHLIWSQHSLFARLFKQPFEDFSTLIFSVHLSPFEMLELSSLAYMTLIGAYFIANSPETADKLSEFGIDRKSIHISYNCSPSDFCCPSPKEILPLKKIVIVSNHPPKEVQAAAKLLQRRYNVNLIGDKNPQLVTPEILHEFDCIISIGKTVQYALLANKAVYCYDHFGGPGYLNNDNYTDAQYNNFSGRGFGKKTAKKIVREVIYGYEAENNFVKEIRDKSIYQLELFFDRLLFLPPQIIDVTLQKIIHKSYPVEEKIAVFYRGKQKFSAKSIKYKKQRNILTFLLLLLLFINLWALMN